MSFVEVPVVRESRVALWVATALGGLGQSLAGVSGTLLADHLGGSESFAGLPQALLIAGAAVSAPILSRVSSVRGRRAGLRLGVGVAVGGCVLLIAATAWASLLATIVGCLLLGAGQTAVMLARYAAADLVTNAERARAMASVLAATAAGAVLGPNLLAPTDQLAMHFGWPDLSGPYVVAGIAFVASAWMLGRLGPTPVRESTGVQGNAATSSTAVAISVLSLANLVMVATMTMAPVQMHEHTGAGLAVVGLVVSLHIAAMFAPAPLSGALVDRWGARCGALVGCALLAAATGWAAVAADSTPQLAVGLVLLGLGWNVAVVSGSAVLGLGLSVEEAARREGWGEIGMGAAAASGGALSGPVMAAGGYASLAGVAVVVVALLVPVAFKVRVA